MPRAMWLLQNHAPCIEISLREPITGFRAQRLLLADTGAGPLHAPFELVLSVAASQGPQGYLPARPAQIPIGGKVSDDEMKLLNLRPDTFHGDWNYLIRPNVKPRR